MTPNVPWLATAFLAVLALAAGGSWLDCLCALVVAVVVLFCHLEPAVRLAFWRGLLEVVER